MKKLTLFFTVILAINFTYSCKEKREKTPTEESIIKPVKFENRKQENILDWTKTWTLGEGSVSGYKSFGKEEESKRVNGIDPNGKEAVMWECVPDSSTVWDGGFQTDSFDIDIKSPYLFVCWVKKTNANIGKTYYAFNNVEHTTGESITNAFFIGAGSTIQNLNEWHTLVGYIYPENYNDDIEADVISGLYLEGEKIQEGIDYKWTANSINTSVRVHLNNCKDSTEERLYIWNPQLYKVDGTEPKLYTLL